MHEPAENKFCAKHAITGASEAESRARAQRVGGWGLARANGEQGWARWRGLTCAAGCEGGKVLVG
ncbi:MAG: hypothetical protein J6U13_07380 [Salinivirgaceae bacterium]|nr:hypothetical protein [Salinivirgaceae bacterium]